MLLHELGHLVRVGVRVRVRLRLRLRVRVRVRVSTRFATCTSLWPKRILRLGAASSCSMGRVAPMSRPMNPTGSQRSCCSVRPG